MVIQKTIQRNQSGDVITIKLGPLQKIVSVVGLIEKNIRGKAGNYVADLTPPEA